MEPVWKKLIETVAGLHKLPHLFDIIQQGSAFLDSQRADFSRISQNIALVCAYESQKIKGTVCRYAPQNKQ